MELAFADTKRLEKEGRNFDCSKCDIKIQKKRRCKEPREDFTSSDGNIWPMYVHSAQGEAYGFCPGKATWDQSLVRTFRLLTIVAETGQLPESGGLNHQPDWLVEVLGWFLPRYSMAKFARQMSMLFGDDKKSISTPNKKPRRR